MLDERWTEMVAFETFFFERNLLEVSFINSLHKEGNEGRMVQLPRFSPNFGTI